MTRFTVEEQHVARFDVQVEHPAVVQVSQAFHDIGCEDEALSPLCPATRRALLLEQIH